MLTQLRIQLLLGMMLSGVASAAEPIPMPRALELDGLHAYSDKILTAGETIHFRVSSTVPYQLSVCRLGWEVEDPDGDEVLFTFPESPPVKQPIHPGSFVHVDKGLPAEEELHAVTLECWVRPWRLAGWQTLISQHDYPTACGFGLFTDGEGRVQFYLGDGGAYQKEWAHAGHLRPGALGRGDRRAFPPARAPAGRRRRRVGVLAAE